MSRPSRFVRAQRMTIVNGILGFVVILVVLQLWLLTATMLTPISAAIGDRPAGAGPAWCASGSTRACCGTSTDSSE